MAIATTTIVAAATAALSATLAGVGAYMSAQASADAADEQKQAARQQAEAERAAGEARRRQVEYDAERKRRSMYSRQAAAGVEIGSGSLLEMEMAYASEAEYAAQLAEYPHQLAGQTYSYQSRLFGYQAGAARSRAPLAAGIAVGSTLASTYPSYTGLFSR